jgi:hypothetical protein
MIAPVSLSAPARAPRRPVTYSERSSSHAA